MIVMTQTTKKQEPTKKNFKKKTSYLSTKKKFNDIVYNPGGFCFGFREGNDDKVLFVSNKNITNNQKHQ